MEIELPDGTVLEAPDGANIKAVVQGYLRSKGGAGTPSAPPQVGTPSAPPQVGTPAEPTFAEGSRKFNDQLRSAFVRPVVQGLTFLPAMAADAAVGTGNFLFGGNMKLPSQTRDEVLDKFTLRPEGAGKIAEIVSSGLVGGASTPASLLTQGVNKAATQTGAQYLTPQLGAEKGLSQKLLQTVAGKKSVEQAVAVSDQQTTNALARKALGLAKDAELSIPTLKAIRESAGAAYEKVARAGTVVPDEQFVDDLAKLDSGALAVLKDFPEAAPAASESVRKLVGSLLRDKFDARSALAYLKELRADAAANLKFTQAADPAKRTLGMAQREAASTLEELLERHLTQTGQQGLAQEFQAARQLIAKTYAVQGALNESTGNVVASALGGQLKRGKVLTGELETIAKFARSFPKAAREITESFPGVSQMDVGLSTALSLATGSVLPALYPAARMAARKALLMKYAQEGGKATSPRLINAVGAGVEDATR